MVLGDDAGSLLLLAMVDEPSGRFRDQVNKEELEDGGETLEQGRYSPRPRVVDAESAKGGPGGDDGAKIPRRVVERSELSTVGREGQLSDEDGGGQARKSETETNEESSACNGCQLFS